jgi:hypothetical protein
MAKEIAILYSISAALILFAISYSISLFFAERKVKKTMGTIVNTSYAVAETMRVYNSKWANMSYTVNGRGYISENRMQVPMNAEIGEQFPLKYYVEQPARLYTRSAKWPMIALGVAAACFLIASIQ